MRIGLRALLTDQEVEFGVLARRAGVGTRTLSRLAAGKTALKCRTRTLPRIAIALRLPLAEIEAAAEESRRRRVAREEAERQRELEAIVRRASREANRREREFRDRMRGYEPRDE